MDGAGRETAGATTCLIVRYVRNRAGEDGVARMLARAGSSHAPEELEDEQGWTTYAQKVALFEAAAEVLGDPHVSRHMGESALEMQVGARVRVLLRALGSPGFVLSNVAKAAPKFSTVASMDALDVGRTHALVTYRLHSPNEPHRLDCEYNIGLIRVIGPLFGIAPLRVEHPECQVDGAAQCLYEVSWPRWSRLPWRRRGRAWHLEEQVSALAAQLESLQSNAADLVSSDDLSSVLSRIVTRAGAAVSAPRYLLAVRTADASPLRVHADGFGEGDAETLGQELLSAPLEDGDEHRLVIEVESARRSYGRLAAFYDDHTFFPHERRLLAAYARSAAAALDAATALEEARRRGETAAGLLDLARALALLSTPEDVARRLADAMPPVLHASSSLVFLWDAERGDLLLHGHHGWPHDVAEDLGRLGLRALDSPEVARWVVTPRPSFVTMDGANDFTSRVLTRLGKHAAAIVPIARQGELLGLAGAAFDEGEVPGDIDDLLERAAAVADQAATAIQNAHLLARVRHQTLHDSLTSLPNRVLFEEHARKALARAARDGGQVAILFIDLDRFKPVNDGLGHAVGDTILAEVACRLGECTRDGDVVARVGGDEFTMLLPGVDDRGAMEVAERVHAALRRPVGLADQPIVISTSIGLSTYPEDGDGYEDLLRCADRAMYRAKARGRDNTQRYRPTPAWPERVPPGPG